MIISRTPLRASFFGGGTDLKEYYSNGFGSVLSTAINMYIYITVNKKFDDLIRVSYSKTELVDSVDKLEHNIIREALKIVGIDKGIDIVYMGDVPLGSTGVGLASSSALAVGVLNALYAYKGVHVSAELLARKACEIEIKILENPIGKQDQYAVAYGGFNHLKFNADESVFVTPLVCHKGIKSQLNKKLMFFYTGITRYSSGILNEQKSNTKAKNNVLNKMLDIVSIAQETLIKNDLDTFGELLNESWELKKTLASGISNNDIDELYRIAKTAGATGGKILGAGGGGFLMLYCNEEYQENVRNALKSLREIKMEFELQGSRIIHISD
jgi:D-glycero-alpha-D-manno-heptose-7-phosphate kinase